MTSDPAALRSLIRTVEAVRALPAVPTEFWFDRAAWALLDLHAPAVVLVRLISRIPAAAAPVRVEAVGVASRMNPAPATTGAPPYPSNQTLASGRIMPLLLPVRAASERVVDLGYPVPRLPEDRVWGAALESDGTSEPWKLGSLGTRWATLPVRQMVVGAAELGGPEGGRRLSVEIALLGGNASDAERVSGILRAILPLLARRAALALFGDEPGAERLPIPWLTAREEEVLYRLLLGKSVREIGTELSRSIHTVHDHVKSLHRKLNATSRGQLVARTLGFVGTEDVLRDMIPRADDLVVEITEAGRLTTPPKRPAGN